MDILPTNGFIGQINLGEAVFPQRIIIHIAHSQSEETCLILFNQVYIPNILGQRPIIIPWEAFWKVLA